MNRVLSILGMGVFVLAACGQAAAPSDARAPNDAVMPADANDQSCDARIGAKQASCGAPPQLAVIYRDMWCGMSPTSDDLSCFEALTCEQMETEIHAGRFPCLEGR